MVVRRFRALGFQLLVLAICALLAATATATGKPSSARARFVLGMICSCSGPQQSSLGDTGSAIEAWASWVNAAGGVNGYLVRVIVMDDGENPATSLDDAKKLVTQDHVMAIVGDSSLVDASWAKYISEAGVPVVGGVSQETSFVTNPDFFPSGAQTSPIPGIIALAKAAGKKHVAYNYCAESPICAASLIPAQASARLLGVTVTGAAISSTAPSYAAPCLADKDAGVDAIWVGDDASVVQRVAADCATQGYKPLELGELASSTTDWFTDAQLNGMELVSNNADPFDTSIPAVRTFQAALRRYAPATLTASSHLQEPNTIFPWTGGRLFQAAATAVHLTPTSTPAELKRGLYALKNETLDGLSPPLNFKPGRASFVPCYFTDELTRGLIVPLDGGQPSCLSAAIVRAIAH